MKLALQNPERLHPDVRAELENLISGIQTQLTRKVTQGGRVVQKASKSSAVQVGALAGQIQTNPASLAAATIVSFRLVNSTIQAQNIVTVQHIGGGTLGAYGVTAKASAGYATIYLRNNTAGALAETLTLSYVVNSSVVV